MVTNGPAAGNGKGGTGTIEPQKQQKAFLPRLTALRAFAAFYVITDHLALFGIEGHGRLPFDIGFTAVAFFFIISGFVLTWSGAEMAATDFYWRRIARIYPTYLFVLVVAMVVPVSDGTGHLTVKSGLYTAFLVQSWAIHNPNTPFAVNGVSWSLSCEAAFYLAFPLLVRIFVRLSPMWRWALAIAWWGACSAFVLHGGIHHFPLDYTNPVIRSGEFVLGIVAALEVRRGWRLPGWAAVVVILAALGGTAAVTKTIPSPDVPLAPLYFVVVVWCAGLDLASDRGWLRWRWLVYAGEVSYCFYLIQEIIIVNLKPDLGTGPAVALLMIVVSAASAVVLHHLVEKPCQRLLLRYRPRLFSGRR